ncbi:MAG: hypothetical protein K6G48_03695 [Acholeplasmatales bacterium]|nr:hypothetical protein [Acholeplasmatales bacterium]
MEKIFNYIKNTSIVASVLRLGLGIIFMILGFILGYYYNSIWIVIAVLLCMAESVIIIALQTRKGKRRLMLEQSIIDEYFKGFKRVSSSNALSKAYKMFMYDKILSQREMYYLIEGSINGINVSICKAKGVIGFHLFKTYYITIYAIDLKKEIDLNEIKSSCLRNYRYEVFDNKLFITTICSSSRGRAMSLEPTVYKNYNEWVKRIKAEYSFIELLCKRMED